MASSWCKVDAAFDTNRKAVKAGRLGREVFLFLLRRIALADAPGQMNAEEMAPWFVAKVLEMPEEEARAGIAAAIAADLIAIDDELVRVVGWEDEWGKRPLTEAERKANQRARAARSKRLPVGPSKQLVLPEHVEITSVTKRHDVNVTGPDSHAREENRSEIRNTHVSVFASPDSGSSTPAPLERVQALAVPAPEPRAEAEAEPEPGTEPTAPEPRALLALVPMPREDGNQSAYQEPDDFVDHRETSRPSPPEDTPIARWWTALRAEHRRLRDLGIEPDAEDFAPTCAGAHAANVGECMRNLASSGYGELQIDAKMRHVIAVRGAQAEHRDRSLEFFKPAIMFNPVNFARACDMTMAEAKAKAKTAAFRAGKPTGNATEMRASSRKPAAEAIPVMSAEDRAFNESLAHAARAIGFEAAAVASGSRREA